MPVWLIIFLGLLGVMGLSAVAFGFVMAVIDFKHVDSDLSVGLIPADGPGNLSIWFAWDPAVVGIHVYRLRMMHASPYSEIKEGQFTVTFDPPRDGPFIQTVVLTRDFRDLIEFGPPNKRSLITIEVRTVEEVSVQRTYTISKLREIYYGEGQKAPRSAEVNRLGIVVADPPDVTSLDYQELQARKVKLAQLEATAKAKAERALKPPPLPPPAPPKVEVKLEPPPEPRPEPVVVVVEGLSPEPVIVVETKPVEMPAPIPVSVPKPVPVPRPVARPVPRPVPRPAPIPVKAAPPRPVPVKPAPPRPRPVMPSAPRKPKPPESNA